MTALAPYQSSVAPPRPPGFRSLLLAEWTKLRTVRGFLIALLLVVVLPVGFTLLGRSECSVSNSQNQSFACPAAPVGPDGEAVDDSFYFVHQALPANGSITAEVTGLTGHYATNNGNRARVGAQPTLASGTQGWSKAGIMIKASTRPGSAYAAMMVTGSNGTRMQWDYTGDVAGLPGGVSASSPRWLRLVRSGSVVTGYDSLNGSTWTQVGRYGVHGLPATGTVQVGLFASSPSHVVFGGGIGSQTTGQGPSVATGTLRHVALSGASAASSWTATDVTTGNGPPGQQAPGGPFSGSVTSAGPGAFTVTGAGVIAPDVPSAPDSIGASVQVALAGMFVGLIVVIILGALFIAAEYRRGMIRVTLAAAPSRWKVLAAKAVVIFLATFAVGLIAVSATLPIGLHLLRIGGNPIDPISALTQARMIVGTALLLAVSAVLALAIGVMARRSALAIVAVVAVIFIPYILVTVTNLLPLSAQEWLLRVLPVAAFSVQQAYPAYHQVLAQYEPSSGYYPLPPWGGFAVLVAWAAVALVAAGWLLHRRDA
ncbi:MAG TPA: ABC transporter permease subunit [Trebonia sp.]|nr:ABC transporter permease subunit [Trebonia sp.]